MFGFQSGISRPNFEGSSSMVTLEITYAVSTVFYTVGVLVILCNLLVIIPVLREKRLRKLKYMPLFSFAVAEIICGIAAIFSVFVARSASSDWSQRAIPLFMFGHCACVLNITVVFMERWVAIFHPLKYHHILKKRRLVALICIAWLLALVLTTPIAVFHEISQTGQTVHINDFGSIYLITVDSVFLVLTLVIGCMQVRTLCVVRRHLRRTVPVLDIRVQPLATKLASTDAPCSEFPRSSLQNVCHERPRFNFRMMDYKHVWAVNAVYLVMIITWSPIIISTLIMMAGDSTSVCRLAIELSMVLLLLNCVINPIIFSLRMTCFRRSIKEMLFNCKFCSKRY
ncbi:adrenocorticotropic hormone receptor-like [Rhopilema esculentum]|uniref:adrenocorticotropic hormone receptor-like n=1 Tax=Rhopilema esculentum TaxID=499914 RepID=UPI0031D8980B